MTSDPGSRNARLGYVTSIPSPMMAHAPGSSMIVPIKARKAARHPLIA